MSVSTKHSIWPGFVGLLLVGAACSAKDGGDDPPSNGAGTGAAGVGAVACMSATTSPVVGNTNPPQMSGTATGVINFLNFTFSALLGPVFGWVMASVSTGAAMTLEHYQTAFEPLLWGVALAVLLTLALQETGSAVRAAEAAARRTA